MYDCLLLDTVVYAPVAKVSFNTLKVIMRGRHFYIHGTLVSVVEIKLRRPRPCMSGQNSDRATTTPLKPSKAPSEVQG